MLPPISSMLLAPPPSDSDILQTQAGKHGTKREIVREENLPKAPNKVPLLIITVSEIHHVLAELSCRTYSEQIAARTLELCRRPVLMLRVCWGTAQRGAEGTERGIDRRGAKNHHNQYSQSTIA